MFLNLLCEFAHRFPKLAAEILDRDRHKRRNFREETITDILMAGLVPFEPFGIMTNYPANESLTGEDMDWEFVNEHATDGRCYLRLHIQAKRAHSTPSKIKPYWLYRELDHAIPSSGSCLKYGTQHKQLVEEAKKVAGCVPLYMFYHPKSAIPSPPSGSPAVEGVNWMFADCIPMNVSSSRWQSQIKRLDKWRPHFHPLSDLLCFDRGVGYCIPMHSGDGSLAFLIGPEMSAPTPGEIEDMLNQRRDHERDLPETKIRAVKDIPSETLAIIGATQDGHRKADIKRPRVIFVSNTKELR